MGGVVGGQERVVVRGVGGCWGVVVPAQKGVFPAQNGTLPAQNGITNIPMVLLIFPRSRPSKQLYL